MKNVTKLITLTSALLFSVASFAVEDTSDDSAERSLKISGKVPLICNFTPADDALVDFGHDLAKGQKKNIGGMKFQCNSKTGATVTLTSANKGLANDGSKDHVVNYEAWLKMIGFEGGKGFGAEFFANKGSGSVNLPKDKMLAMGAVKGTITIIVVDDVKFAGEYTDTLTVTMTARS